METQKDGRTEVKKIRQRDKHELQKKIKKNVTKERTK